MIQRFSALLAAACLASCAGEGPVDDSAGNSASLPAPADVGGSAVGTASADGSAPANVLAPGGRAPLTSGDTASAAQSAIPAALHGRWAMSPADCTGTPGNSMGLLVVSGDGLRFHQSTARAARNVERSANAISGDFDYSGKGQSWTKFESLELQEDKLVRTESSPMASFTYVRCR